MKNYKIPKIIAEIGCNHKGNMVIAKDMIKKASFCKVDVVKFQKRTPKKLLTAAEYNTPHKVEYNSYGDTYGKHREILEFDIEQHIQLIAWCGEFNLEYSTSVWDMTSAKQIVQLNPVMLKIPSACNLNKPMLNYLCDYYFGEIHVSLGMTTQEEEDLIVSLFLNKKRVKDLVLYSCTSGYPVSFKDVTLLEIVRIKKKFENVVKAIGFSGHHLGISIDIAAYILGVTWIERHFTLDRTWKGSDHAASLEPQGLEKLVRDIGSVHKALNFKNKNILDVEEEQRDKLKKNQIHWENDYEKSNT